MTEKSEPLSAPTTPVTAFARDPSSRAPIELDDISVPSHSTAHAARPPRNQFAQWWESHVYLKVPIAKCRDHLGFIPDIGLLIIPNELQLWNEHFLHTYALHLL